VWSRWPRCFSRRFKTVRKMCLIPTAIHSGALKSMAKRHLKLVTPAAVNRTVTPRRLPNAKLRTREYLTEAEVERLIEAAKGNRWGHRDATMLLVAYRHGLRASELTDLRWDQVEFGSATLHVRRVKQGAASTHPIRGDEMRALRRLKREQEPKSPFVFTSERGAPFTTAGFARMMERAGLEANLPLNPTRTCCGTPAATRSRTRDTTRGRSKATSVTRTSSTRCATPNLRRPGSRTSGAEILKHPYPQEGSGSLIGGDPLERSFQS
jgi:integrase